MNRLRLTLLLLVILISVLIRFALFIEFPIFLTADSWEYLSISESIYQHLDFYSGGLGDWRLPIYPLFLVFLRAMTDFDAASIVLAQKALGLGSIALGITIGYLLRSYLVTGTMALFLGLNPVYLLNEHLIMTEGLFLFTLLGFTAIVLICYQQKVNFAKSVLLGLSFGLCTLTRANGLFFCLSLIAAIILVRFVRPAGCGPFPAQRPSLSTFLSGLFVGVLLTFGPWLWRNHIEFGTLTPFTHNTRLNVLIYFSQHDLIDISLPLMYGYRNLYDPKNPQSIYTLTWAFRRDIVNGERIAGQLVREQLINQPHKYTGEVVYSFFHYIGYPIANANPGRTDVQWWFGNMLNHIERVHSINADWYKDADAAYITSRTGGPFTVWWRAAGLSYLALFRLALFSLFVILFIGYLTYRWRLVPDMNHVVILSLGAAVFATITLHAFTLSDYPRFAAPFEWIPLLVSCLIIRDLANSQSWKTGGPLRRKYGKSHND